MSGQARAGSADPPSPPDLDTATDAAIAMVSQAIHVVEDSLKLIADRPVAEPAAYNRVVDSLGQVEAAVQEAFGDLFEHAYKTLGWPKPGQLPSIDEIRALVERHRTVR